MARNTQMSSNAAEEVNKQSLIKQKWQNNKNAFSGPLHKKPEGKSSAEGANGGSSSKNPSQTRAGNAMEVYGATPTQ